MAKTNTYTNEEKNRVIIWIIVQLDNYLSIKYYFYQSHRATLLRIMNQYTV